MFLLISRNSAVDMAVKNRVVDGSKPVRIGTRNVAPNMAMTCCAPISAVRGQVSLSSGLDDLAGLQRLPSPWSFHVNRPAIDWTCDCLLNLSYDAQQERAPRNHTPL